MIRFLTEDKSDYPLVYLFNKAYGDDVLYCSDSNTRLYKKAKSLAKDGSQVIVYMDMVPDNEFLVGLYRRVFSLYSKDNLDVVIMPIVCAEYLFIRSVVGVAGTVSSTVCLDEILIKSPTYRSSALAASHIDDEHFNFEKFCKAFCKECLSLDCCAIDLSNSDVCHERRYFKGDCLCSSCQTRMSLRDKSIRFLGEYPVVPSAGRFDVGEISWGTVIDISRSLVDEYNKWAIRCGYPLRQIEKRKIL